MLQHLRIIFRDHMTSFRSILLSFLIMIFTGAVLLTLPAASRSGVRVPFLDALFTSTSAACVTGLVVYDTATQWSLFGKCVILVLIQIGGLGVITALVAAMLLTGQKVGLRYRLVMQEAVSAPHVGGILSFTKFFLKVTLWVELCGAALLTPVFISDFGPVAGIGYAVFHSVSAFCNAGFDLMGVRAPFSSLTHYTLHPWVNIVIALLIIMGGIGFMTWKDVSAKKFNWRMLRLQTKLILVTTAVLLAVGFLYFYLFEFTDVSGQGERILLSMFASVTPRTAGFNTADYSTMSESGLMVTIFLMMIGGAPGSTAGGMKLTTIAVIVLATYTYMRGQENCYCFQRRIRSVAIHSAYTLFAMYFLLLLTGTLALAGLEKEPVIRTMFECASALGTVGLSTGITPGLCAASKLILIFFMYFGRVGALTLTYAMTLAFHDTKRRFPVEDITVG
ncbi:MAG: potassium transporter TrkG [Eubacteriales bacterium]|nr:potassium transporter TrkG [Eubacteriales bacterium]